MHPTAASVLAITSDSGRTWATPSAHGLRGYRSCVVLAQAEDNHVLLACGPSGCDWSADAGRTWHPLADKGFHAMDMSPDGRFGWAVGADGRVARWTR